MTQPAKTGSSGRTYHLDGEGTPACLVCGAELPRAWEEDVSTPNGGLSFQTHGHYGSSAFDPMDSRLLQINVCDPCIRRGAEQGRVLLARVSRPVVVTHLGKWDGVDG